MQFFGNTDIRLFVNGVPLDASRMPSRSGECDNYLLDGGDPEGGELTLEFQPLAEGLWMQVTVRDHVDASRYEAFPRFVREGFPLIWKCAVSGNGRKISLTWWELSDRPSPETPYPFREHPDEPRKRLYAVAFYWAPKAGQ